MLEVIYPCQLKIVNVDLFKITQAWIYEHIPCMGRRALNSRYDETLPRPARYAVGHHISSFIEVRAHLDRLTYSDVVWTPNDSHRATRPFESISLFRGTIRYGDTTQKCMPDRVLWQFGYEQRIPDVVLPYDDGFFETIDYRLLHFADHLISGLTPASEPHACSDDYMDWFMHISHPFISLRAEDEGLHVSSRRRPRSLADTNPHPPSEQDQRQVSYLDCQCF